MLTIKYLHPLMSDTRFDRSPADASFIDMAMKQRQIGRASNRPPPDLSTPILPFSGN
jgi:hypothetical protein